jgi:hypothetical protein
MSDDRPASLTQEELEQLYYDAAREGQEALLAEFLRQGADPNRPERRSTRGTPSRPQPWRGLPSRMTSRSRVG